MDKLEYAVGLMETTYRRAFKLLFRRNAPYHALNGHRVMRTSTEVSEYIASKLVTGKPFAAGRFGFYELAATRTYIHKQFGTRKTYSDRTQYRMLNNAGFFSCDEQSLDRFGELMLQCIGQFDLFGVWNANFELPIIRSYAPGARGCILETLEPYYDPPSGWTKVLAGKKVLVVHPFEQTIIEQYKKRAELFADNMLPDFELKTIKAVQTIAGQKDERFSDWFEALDYMKAQIDRCDYDVAIIGCGAYGFPLAAHVKSRGKQAIHLGGATQLLFGIRGNRWEEYKAISKLVNPSWTRASDDEKPKKASTIEDACYW